MAEQSASEYGGSSQLIHRLRQPSKAVTVKSCPYPYQPEIMVVEPNAADCEHLKAILKGSYPVHWVHTAAEAFALLRTVPIALLLSDAVIPDAGITDFIATVKEHYPDVVTIVSSESKDVTVAVRLINDGRAFRYLLKPISPRILENAVRFGIALHLHYVSYPNLNPRRIESQAIQLPVISASQPQSFEEALAVMNRKRKIQLTY